METKTITLTEASEFFGVSKLDMKNIVEKYNLTKHNSFDDHRYVLDFKEVIKLRNSR